MKRFAFGLSLLCLSALPVMADDVTDPMAATYGNTLVAVDGKGLESHTYYNADHTFTGVAPAYSYHYQGRWEITADGQLCRTFDPAPPGITNPDCAAMSAHAVGDKWTLPDGGTVTLAAGVN